MTRFFSLHLDFVGFWASLLCALHCMFVPLVFTLGLLTKGHWSINPIGERIFIGTSICIACWSLLQSYFNKHQNIRPLFIAGLGFFLLFIAQAQLVTYVHLLMALGGGLIAYAHFYNWQLTQQSRTSKIKPWYKITPGKIATIILLLFYFLGLRSAFEHDNRPPSREEMLQLVWGRKISVTNK